MTGLAVLIGCLGAFIALGHVFGSRAAETGPDAEHHLFEGSLNRLEAILEWLEAHSAVAAMRVPDAEAILIVSDGATFQARNNRIVEACETGHRVTLRDVDLNCVDELMKNLGGTEGEDAAIRLVALDALLLGLYVSEATYALERGAYSQFSKRMGAFLQKHGAIVTSQMRRTLGYISEDLKDAGLAQEARCLKDGLKVANETRKAQRQIREIKQAEQSVPSVRGELDNGAPHTEGVGAAES